MATRAYAGSTPRRRPAARKRPAARRAGTRIKWDRIGRIALVLVLVVVGYSYLNPAIELVKTYTQTTAAKAQLHEQLLENKQLHREIHSAKDPLVIAGDARSQGMLAKGETPVVLRH
jgi:cell division protein FtsB